MSAPIFTHRTHGQSHGPINRLVSPGELGRVLKPFVFLDAVDIDVDQPLNFDWHPHSGIATATVHFDGASWAEETNGSRHDVPAGGLEFVRAGGGVWHRGGPSGGGRVTAFQLWLALNEEQELMPAAAQYFAPDELPTQGPVRVVLGEYAGHRSPVPSAPGITYLQIELEAGQQATLEPGADETAFVAVLDGSVDVKRGESSESLEGIELGVLDTSAGPVVVEGRSSAKLVYGSAPPHPHDLVLGRYSVHTSRAALEKGEQGIAKLRRT